MKKKEKVTCSKRKVREVRQNSDFWALWFYIYICIYLLDPKGLLIIKVNCLILDKASVYF